MTAWHRRPAAPAPGSDLCAAADVAEGAGKGREFRDGSAVFRLFVVRQGGTLRGYVNECPHAATPLDWQEDRFFTADGSALLCSTHGARFAVDDGRCFLGPCKGQALTPVPVEERDGRIRIADR